MKGKYLVKGAITELIATFADDESLDLGMYRNEVKFQINAGIKGLFVNGLSGETLYMTREEKKDVTKVAVEEANGKVPVIGNIAEIRPKDALSLLRDYEELGVDAICITQPTTLGYSQEYLVKYYLDLANATELPVIVYNAPQTNNTLTVTSVGKIVNGSNNVMGYKDSTQDIIHLQCVMDEIKDGKHFECFAGSDATIYPTLAVGGYGIISLISAVFPKPIIEVCDLYFTGDIKGALKKQEEILRIRTALKGGPFLAGYKYAASLIGLPMGTLRGPLSDASDAEKEKIKKNLQKLNLL